MKRYFAAKVSTVEQAINKIVNVREEPSSSKQSRIEIDLNDLPSDPGLRKLITDYHPNDRDNVRRAYLQKGPCQPHEHDFPQRKIGKKLRRFVPAWFKEYSTWLEYSISKDAAFCLYCYLYRSNIGEQANNDSFIAEGFTNWKKKERFQNHIGAHNSSHNHAWKQCEDLMNQKQHIEVAFESHSVQTLKEYKIRLTATIDCIRFLLHQGLAFCGNDESEDLNNQGNFIELLKFLANHNEEINKVTLDNAPGNCKFIASEIQKDVVVCIASIETTKVIIKDLCGEMFAILIDESRDILVKDQMAVVLRYVNAKGCVIERFLGIVHVTDTTAMSLKLAMNELFSKYGLSVSSLRGQGYDGASNMNGEFNGLKALILKENMSAYYYVHCFAHQLQLALVAVAKNHVRVALLFNVVSNLSNIVGASCKRRYLLREKQYDKVIEALQNGEIHSGTGLHQETSLQRAGDTQWSLHYLSLVSLITMFFSMIDVLDVIQGDGTNAEQRGQACALLALIQSFEFVFHLHLMKKILGFTNDFSQALQRKDQDIINAITLVNISKQLLQQMRDDGWTSLLDQVVSFCEKNDIVVPKMDDMFVDQGRSRRNAPKITNLHHYQTEIFYTVIDKQLLELNDRFTEKNSELLLCVACLNPIDSFAAFDKQKLIKLVGFYPHDFSTVQVAILDDQLETYITDVRYDSRFFELRCIGDLAKRLVESKKNVLYPLVYLLVKLALILPVATASVERVFSAMNLVKTPLRNRLGDEFLNDCLVTYIEREIFNSIDNEKIIKGFQNMKNPRGQL